MKKKLINLVTGVIACGLLLCLVSNVYAVPVLVKNGGFETGDLSYWSSGGQAGVQKAVVYSGSYAAYIGTVDFDKDNKNDFTNGAGDNVYNNWIQQTIDVTGADSLSLWYNVYTNDYGNNDNPAFVIKINDTPEMTIAAKDISGGKTGWTSWTYDLTGYDGNSLTLTIYAGNTYDTSFQSWAYVDDVSLTYPDPVPLPPSAYMLFPVLAGLVFWRRKK